MNRASPIISVFLIGNYKNIQSIYISFQAVMRAQIYYGCETPSLGSRHHHSQTAWWVPPESRIFPVLYGCLMSKRKWVRKRMYDWYKRSYTPNMFFFCIVCSSVQNISGVDKIYSWTFTSTFWWSRKALPGDNFIMICKWQSRKRVKILIF